MAIQTQTFQTLLQNAAAAVQGAARQLLDFSIGSVVRAIMEASAALGLWLQAIALQVAALTRFSTSAGADADSWAADFDFKRLLAQSATGPVTLARFTPTTQAVVPVGTFVQTQDGTQRFELTPDTNQTAYDPVQAAYIIPANTPSISATVVAAIPGAGGNVAVGTINTLSSAIVGVDTVTNPGGLANGADAETDPAFRARFWLYIAGLSKATVPAISSAIENTKQGVVNSITENMDFSGATDAGNFYAVVDDGSGNPSDDFLSTVASAIEDVRPIGSTFQVFGPTVIGASIGMTLTLASGYDGPTVRAQVTSALQDFVSSLTLGQTLPYTRLAQIAYDVSPGITNVTNVVLNGGTADLVATNQQAIRASAIAVS